MVYIRLIVAVIGQFSHDVIGCQSTTQQVKKDSVQISQSVVDGRKVSANETRTGNKKFTHFATICQNRILPLRHLRQISYVTPFLVGYNNASNVINVIHVNTNLYQKHQCKESI